MMRIRGHRALVAMIGVVGLIAGVSGAKDEIVREGVGERRAALDKMELTDFDQSLWSGLTEWVNGEAVTPTTVEGKVVLVYTWSAFLPTAVRPMSVVNRLAERFGERGLVVVGVHNDEGWEDAARTAERRRATFPIARDAGNAFREAMRVDQDPDFFVIDRSGRLRYADIETASVERAVAGLLDESVGEAQTLLDRMADAEARAAEDARRAARLRSRINLADLPWPDFAPPSEEAYASAAWPEMDTGDDTRRRRRSAPAGPVEINWNDELTWSPGFPEHTEGRVTLIYLFNPKAIEQSARGGGSLVEALQGLDQLQVAHARDLLVVGAMISPTQDNGRRRRRGDEDEMKPEEIAERFRKMLEIPVNHVRVADLGGSIVTSRLTPNNGEGSGRSSRRGGQAFIGPYHILVSSDGVVRWHGNIASSRERYAEWEAALDTMLKVDPGVAARRAAEQAYIRSVTE